MATPTITNKKAEARQGKVYGGGVVSGLLSWAAFSAGNPEAGLLLGGVAVALFYGGSKIKTRWRKTGQVDVYR